MFFQQFRVAKKHDEQPARYESSDVRPKRNSATLCAE
jgi:hypothetical protein